MTHALEGRLAELERRVAALEKRERVLVRGATIEWRTEAGWQPARISDIDACSLHVEFADGHVASLRSGDIRHLRDVARDAEGSVWRWPE